MSKATSIEVFGGELIDLTKPNPEQINVEDIAHSLGFTARFQGHTKHFSSVAQHSVLVCDLVRLNGGNPQMQLAALFHDAHEAYLGDIPTPLKTALRAAGTEYDKLTRGLDRAIAERFGIIPEYMHGELVRLCDQAALVLEARESMPSKGELLGVDFPEEIDASGVDTHIEHAEPFSLAIEDFLLRAEFFALSGVGNDNLKSTVFA